MTTFDQWTRDVDALCVKHLCCNWADLAGDREPLQTSFKNGETPMEFVQPIGGEIRADVVGNPTWWQLSASPRSARTSDPA